MVWIRADPNIADGGVVPVGAEPIIFRGWSALTNSFDPDSQIFGIVLDHANILIEGDFSLDFHSHITHSHISGVILPLRLSGEGLLISLESPGGGTATAPGTHSIAAPFEPFTWYELIIDFNFTLQTVRTRILALDVDLEIPFITSAAMLSRIAFGGAGLPDAQTDSRYDWFRSMFS